MLIFKGQGEGIRKLASSEAEGGLPWSCDCSLSYRLNARADEVTATFIPSDDTSLDSNDSVSLSWFEMGTSSCLSQPPPFSDSKLSTCLSSASIASLDPADEVLIDGSTVNIAPALRDTQVSPGSLLLEASDTTSLTSSDISLGDVEDEFLLSESSATCPNSFTDALEVTQSDNLCQISTPHFISSCPLAPGVFTFSSSTSKVTNSTMSNALAAASASLERRPNHPQP
ncbi:unnamed protein product, partial [Protopolystoma xenopodis]